MKKLITLTSLIILLSGCSMVTVKTPDCESSYMRFWFEQEGFKAAVCGGKAEMARTTNNVDALESMFGIAARLSGVPLASPPMPPAAAH